VVIIKTNRFDFEPTAIAGLYVVQRKSTQDQRGFFSRFFCADEFREIGMLKPIVQINSSYTKKKGAARGLHFQYPPYAEIKIVSCIKGEIFDVAVDLRKGSPTFLQWHGEVLSAANWRTLLIPEGFAHGFQTLTECCELIYLHSASFHPESEGALHIADPKLNIAWPLALTELSERDNAHAFIGPDFWGIAL
jgi:dTDP-4-dehydrorhamnose 3,5-epimerase